MNFLSVFAIQPIQLFLYNVVAGDVFVKRKECVLLTIHLFEYLDSVSKQNWQLLSGIIKMHSAG